MADGRVDIVDFEWGGSTWTRTFVRSPGFEELDDVRNWLLAQGVFESDQRVERGPDGMWRGSGEVTGG